MKKIRLAALTFLVGGLATALPFYVKLAIFTLIAVGLWITYDEYCCNYASKGRAL